MTASRITILLTGIYLITSLALVWFVWNEWTTYQTTKNDLLNDSRIMELRNNIVHLDEVLTMSSRMAAATGDLQWQERYNSYKPKLDAAFVEAVRLSPEPFRAKAVSDAEAANTKLVEMEKKSFELILQGRINEAKALLFSDEYEKQKIIYAQGMTQFVLKHPQFLRLEELRGIIIHLDEVLTMSARMAAATGDLQWEKRYRNSESILDAAIRDAINLAPDSRISRLISKTDLANRKLVEMENQSFKLIQSGLIDEAKAILFGDEYTKQKLIYHQGMDNFSKALSSLSHKNLSEAQTAALVRVFVTVLLLLFLILAWFVVIRVVTNWIKTLSYTKELKHQITLRRKAELALKLANQSLRKNEMLLIEAQKISHLGHWDWNIQKHELVWSDEIYRIFGLNPQKFNTSYEAFLQAVHIEDREKVNDAVKHAIDDQAPYDLEHRIVLPSGEERIVHEQARIDRDEKGEAVRMFGTVLDITERKKTEERLLLAASVMENTSEGVIICDTNANIIEVNTAFCNILGYSREEVIGQNPRIWRSDRHDKEFFDGMWQELTETGNWRGEIWNRRKDGTLIPEWLNISQVLDTNTDLSHYVAVFSDISQIKHSQEKLDHIAHHDILTDLPNRLLLNERLEHALRRADRHNTKLAVCFLDLDHFKHINDSMGHLTGDMLLQAVTERLKQTSRQDDTIARVGGDEFVFLLEDISREEDAVVAAQKLLAAFKNSFLIDHQEIHITASLGICIYPRDGDDVDKLLRNADAAMYRAKEEGRNTYQFYSGEMTSNAFERVLLENSLHQAISNGELYLAYQPQLELPSQRLIGFESLIRWQHPDLGLVSPGKFIPLAEETGLIHTIGQWVLRTACQQASIWLEQGLDFGHIAVNVAGPQIQRGNLLEEVKTVLAETRLPAHHLELEITESFIMQQPKQAIELLSELRHLGVSIAIDDFGTGFSSLSYLKQLPIKKLKIDRSFIFDIPDDPNDMAIVKAVIALSHNLGLNSIAEGVESEEQASFLLDAGCTEVQGYLYSKPVIAEEAEKLPFWQSNC